MVSEQTLKRQVKRINTQSRGMWTKYFGDYVGQSFDLSNYSVWSLDGESFHVSEHAPSFYVYVTRIGKRWFAYSEEHEPDEMIKQGMPANGFTTLYEAKCWIEEWSEEFEELWLQNEMCIDDIEEVWSNF